MPKAFDLEIAAVLIRVSCTGGIPVEDENDPAYPAFLKVPNGDTNPDISIVIAPDSMPDTGKMQRLFVSGESWTMFRNSNGYYLTFHPPQFIRPFWTARMRRSFTDVTVFCDKELLQNQEVDGIVNPVRYPFDQILLMHYLASRKGMVIHAAGIEINKKGYLFAGRSGAGKTTISKQFVSKGFGSMLSDDRVIIRKIDDTFMVFGTPWPGEGGIAVNRGIPLGGLFFLSHSESNRIEEIIPGTTVEKLLPVVSIPWYDPEPMKDILGLCDDLIAHIPSFLLYFKPDTEVVDVFAKRVS